jgi:hypothetical protein
VDKEKENPERSVRNIVVVVRKTEWVCNRRFGSFLVVKNVDKNEWLTLRKNWCTEDLPAKKE